jgi:hypothetical protein
MIVVGLLAFLAVLSGLMAIWAWQTGKPAGDPRPARVPQHSKWNADSATVRLNWPGPRTLAAMPPLEDAPTRDLHRPDQHGHDDHALPGD